MDRWSGQFTGQGETRMCFERWWRRLDGRRGPLATVVDRRLRGDGRPAPRAWRRCVARDDPWGNTPTSQSCSATTSPIRQYWPAHSTVAQTATSIATARAMR